MNRTAEIKAYRAAVSACDSVNASFSRGAITPDQAEITYLGVMLVVEQLEGSRQGRAARYVLQCMGAVRGGVVSPGVAA